MTVQTPNPRSTFAGPSGKRDAAVAFLLSRINYERAATVPYSERTLKLARMRELLDRLGQPAAGIPIIHVAGTKGKGSTAAMIASVLTAVGHRTGLFSSPHLERIEERFCIDGKRCEGETLAALVDRLRPIVAAMDAAASPGDSGPTYFELTTAVALLHFAQCQVDAAVLEVGLGGRLDSTNVCEPALCVITNISLDHTAQLGKSLAAIASEKAGIIKPGIPVISGVLDPTPKAVIAERARRQGSPLIQMGDDFTFQYAAEYTGLPDVVGRLDYFDTFAAPAPPGPKPPNADRPHLARSPDSQILVEALESTSRNQNTPNASPEKREVGFRTGFRISDLVLPLLGRHQAANAAVAIAAIRQLERQGWSIDADAIRHGMSTVRLPARIEVLSRRPMIIVDAAHNVASATALVDAIGSIAISGRRTVLLAATVGKDVRGILRVLLPHFDRVVVTQHQQNPRAMPAEELSVCVKQFQQSWQADAENVVFVRPAPADAWQFVSQISSEDDLICSTGSFFLAAEIRALVLNGEPQC